MSFIDSRMVHGPDGKNINDKLNEQTTQLAESATLKGNLINVRQPPFNAKGDGTDDKQAIQSAIDYAYTNGFKGVYFPKPPVKYSVSDTLLIYSKQSYEGDGIGITTIEQTAVDKPVIASKNYYDNTSPSGRLTIKGITVKGNAANPNNHGFLIRDYGLLMKEFSSSGVGGDGVRVITKSTDNSVPSGNMVEPRFIDFEIRGSGGYGLFIGEADNNKMTDGFITNALIEGSITRHLYIGSSAGWTINGLHNYGTAPDYAVEMLNAYHTKVSNVYIEGFVTRAFNFSKTQEALSLNNISVKCGATAASGRVINIAKSTLVSALEVSVSNLTISQDNATTVYGIYLDSAATELKVQNVMPTGLNKASVIKYFSPDMSKVKRGENIILDSKLSETTNKSALTYNDVSIPSTKRKSISGSAAQTFTFDVTIGSFGKIIGDINVLMCANDNGVLRGQYKCLFMISAKDNTTNAWTVYTNDIVVPSGFTANPVVTVSNTLGGNIGTVTVSFTPTNADSKGSISAIYSGYDS